MFNRPPHHGGHKTGKRHEEDRYHRPRGDRPRPFRPWHQELCEERSALALQFQEAGTARPRGGPCPGSAAGKHQA